VLKPRLGEGAPVADRRGAGAVSKPRRGAGARRRSLVGIETADDPILGMFAEEPDLLDGLG